jgi:large conductance mechanosensitive channel
MPRDVDREASESDSLLDRGHREIRRFWDGFIDFAFQGHILQIAFGLILAATFTDMVKSFVGDILMPPISVILPLNHNIEEKFAVLKPGPHRPAAGYTTLRIAQDDGAVVLAYGVFIYQIVNFVMVGIALYGLAHVYQLVSHDPIIKHTKKCIYCRQSINAKVGASAFSPQLLA